LTPRIVAHCRAGFEAEAAADLQCLASVAETELAADAPTKRGFVVATPRVFDSQRWPRALERMPPMFIRSLFFGTGPHTLFDPSTAKGRPDRVIPLITLIEALRAGLALPGAAHATRGALSFGELRLEASDTNDGKEVSGLCRSLERPLADALRERGILVESADHAAGRLPALHVLLPDGGHAFVGASLAPWGSRWPMGIPRLRMPHSAPSRSTLKLAEAFMTFLDDDERLRWLRPAMRAVDLGAAPGGWTWQLAQRGLRVIAVDNGPLKGEVISDPLIEHLRVDGLSYRPRRAVDWMVCDMVLQPSRIAALVAGWVADGACRRTIFNLKLPMKKRYDEVRHCEAKIRDALEQRRTRYTLRFKQLYHDREEITGYCARVG
jgi:23S rRNA (cytidine2498-2'-O)-methyltransferase